MGTAIGLGKLAKFTRPNERWRVFRVAITPELPSKEHLAGNYDENSVFQPAKLILAGYFGFPTLSRPVCSLIIPPKSGIL